MRRRQPDVTVSQIQVAAVAVALAAMMVLTGGLPQGEFGSLFPGRLAMTP